MGELDEEIRNSVVEEESELLFRQLIEEAFGYKMSFLDDLDKDDPVLTDRFLSGFLIGVTTTRLLLEKGEDAFNRILPIVHRFSERK